MIWRVVRTVVTVPLIIVMLGCEKCVEFVDAIDDEIFIRRMRRAERQRNSRLEARK